MLNPRLLAQHYVTRLLLSNRKSFLLILLVSMVLMAAAAREGGGSTEPIPEVKLDREAALDSLMCVTHSLMGTPYRLGGKTPKAFDCSGFTRFVYGQLGIGLEASAAMQYRQGVEVQPDSLQQGDLVFFQNSKGRIFHVGIFVGYENEQRLFIHASSSRGVTIDKLEASYFAKRWAGVRRFF
ncbi:MAG: C40 family peptidase [Cyclobacteriaceae bacterium]